MKLFHNSILIFIVTGQILACNYISSRDLQRPVAEDITTRVTPDEIFFEKLNGPPQFSDIYNKIFEKKCNSCHSANGKAHSILLDRNSLLSSNLDLVIPGNTTESGLIIAITRNDSKKMPPPQAQYRALTDYEISAITKWIENGALAD